MSIPTECPGCGSLEVRIVTRGERPLRDPGKGLEGWTVDGVKQHALAECSQPECGLWLGWVKPSELLQEGTLIADYAEQLKALKEALNPSVIKKLKGFSYLEGFYVKTELNRIFGPDRWSTYVEKLEHENYTRKGKNNGVLTCTVAYAIVRLEVTFANGSKKVSTDVGEGSGFSYSGDLADCWKGAVTEARTHALKRAAAALGNPFGLSLYDKDNPVHQGGTDSWAAPIEMTPEATKIAEACDAIYQLDPRAGGAINQTLARFTGGAPAEPAHVPQDVGETCLAALRQLYAQVKTATAA